MTDEWEIVNFNLMFEQQLARDYMQNPNPEYAKHLLELAAAHKTNSLGYPMSDELKQFLIDFLVWIYFIKFSPSPIRI